ncbi:MAG: FtsK/SpoIIIE domain-containing protein, partial [Chloroflexota bacterium]|nr:FtsK/SpoIIIE domain-containing protein [Chloroflexota bacterium]
TQIQNQIQGHEMPAPTEREARHYWKNILATLHQRGELQKRPRQGGYVVPQLTVTLLLPQRIIFVLNMQQLGGISRETWASDLDLWRQWRAALDGRVVFVTDSAGLAITVGRDPALGEQLRALPEQEAAAKELPTKILLTADDMPTAPYTVRLGYTVGEAPVDLQLASKHPAILVGGTARYGKTTFLLSTVLQLTKKHTPKELQLAVIDLKQLDFTGEIARLPHYFRPVAYEDNTAEILIQQVEAERMRRRVVFNRAEVSNWLSYNEQADTPLPLLLLVVDEAADLADSAETLIQLVRKGVTAGISLIVATQHPTSDVVSSHIKANLPTAIAFRTRSTSDSRVILGRNGAEELRTKGRALWFNDDDDWDGWQTVQTLYVDRAIRTALLNSGQPATTPHSLPSSVLSAEEVALVDYALTELDGKFLISELAVALQGQVSRRRISNYAQQWEQRGWLTTPRRDIHGYPVGRQVTNKLVKLVSPVSA